MIKTAITSYLAAGVAIVALFFAMWRESQAVLPADVHRLVSETHHATSSRLDSIKDELHSHQLAFDVLASAGWAIIIARKSDHHITHWQGAATDLFGYSEEVALTLTVEDLMASNIRDLHRQHLSRSRPGHSHVIDCRDALHRDGHLFDAALVVSVAKDGQHIVALFRPMGSS